MRTMAKAAGTGGSSRAGAGFHAIARLGFTAAVAAAAGLGALGSAGAAQAAPTSPAAAHAVTAVKWKLAYRTRYVSGLYDVTAPARYRAWAVGQRGTGKNARPLILRWNGKTWGPVSVKGMPDFAPTSVRASSATDVWVFGDDYPSGPGSVAMVYNGHRWTRRVLPAGFQVGSAAVLGASNVWASTSTAARCPACSLLVHWNGRTWTTATVSGLVQSVAGTGGHAWFLALTNISNPNGDYSGRPVIDETAGTRIRKVPAPAVRLMSMGSIAAARDGQLWMLGRLAGNGQPARLFHWTGKAWRTIRIPASVCQPGYSGYCPLSAGAPLTYDGKNGVWATWYAHWTGAKWINASLFSPSLRPVSGLNAVAPIPGTDSTWAAGAIGATARTQEALIASFGPKP